MIKKMLLLILLCFSTVGYAQDAVNRPLTVVLDWFINPDHAPLIVAEQQGFFKQVGLVVKLIQPADPSDGSKWVAAKKADIAITYQPQLLVQVDQGLPLVRFGSLVDSPLDCLVALKSSSIEQIKDLKGKKIGYSAGGTDSVMLQAMLGVHGLTLAQVKLINVRYDLVQALLSGSIHAFTGGMRNVEPIQLARLGHPAQVFLPEENGFPAYDELIFVTHRDAVQDLRLKSFLMAVQQGIDYLIAHPQKSWDMAIKQYPALNNPLNKASWVASVRYFSKHPAALEKNKYEVFAQFMQKQGFIKAKPDLNSYAVAL